MKTRTRVVSLALFCMAAISLASVALAQGPGDVQKKAVSEVAGRGETLLAVEPRIVREPEKPKSPAELSERVQALEKENLVLREDLGKARLDARTGLEQAAKRQAELEARLRQRIDELNADLAAEREAQARRDHNLWLAVGVLALGIIASN